jgi:hypothetical protein
VKALLGPSFIVRSGPMVTVGLLSKANEKRNLENFQTLPTSV